MKSYPEGSCDTSARHLKGAAAVLFGVMLLGARPATAHHSGSAYDQQASVTWQVQVTSFKFVNPHAYVFFTMKDAAGKTIEGRCEAAAKASLLKLGWTANTFRVGEPLTVKGGPGLNEKNVCVLRSFTREGGKEINVRDQLSEADANPPPLSRVAPARTGSSVFAPAAPAFMGAMAAPGRVAAAAAQPAMAHPNLQGNWVSSRGGGPGGPARGAPPGAGAGPAGRGGQAGGPPGGGPRGGGGGGVRPQPSEAGIAAAKSYDQPFDDPAIKCDIANIIFGWTHDQNVNKIEQTEKEVTLTYGYMDFVRRIHLDMAEHPRNLQLSRGGHSIGRWEGNTLVVDTVGLAGGALIPINGVQFSDQTHITERFTLDPQARTLTRAYKVDDPLYLKVPFESQDVMAASDQPYTPYECVELSGANNIRPGK